MGSVFSRKTPQIPKMLPAGWQEDYFTNQYGHSLRYGFAPASGGPGSSKGTVILTHGYGEFIDLYAEAISEYQKMGFDVWAMDFYGFGKSGRNDPKDPHTPDTEGMKRHVDDLHEFITRIVQPDHTRPVVMNTHSMGGHIGLLYLQKHPATFDGAVMSAPMFDIYRLGLPGFFRPLIAGIFKLASKIGLRDVSIPATLGLWTRLKDMPACFTDPGHEQGGLREAFNRLTRQSMPETEIRRPTVGWLSATFKTVASSTTDEALRRVKTPILIGSAGRESLVDVDAHKRASMLMPDAKLVTLPTARHGLWFENDPNYNDWVNQVKSFIGRITDQFQQAARSRPTPAFVTPEGKKPGNPVADSAALIPAMA